MEHQNSQIFCTNSQDSLMGLVCHYQFENGSSQFLFLDVDKDEKIGVFLNHSLSFFVENFVQTIASSNGLILLSSYSEEQSCYYVFNLLTKRSIMILQPCIQGHVIRVGLASNDNYQFEIVIIEVDSSKFNGLKFHIFSSHTNKWKVHHHINLSLPSLPQFEFKELSTPPLYSNCAIHWEIGGYLLVYKVQENNCELIELPNFFEDWSWQSTMTYRRCLCESSECVYYCYIDLDGFHIWELFKENDDNLGSIFDSKKFRWRLVHSVMHENFVSKHQNFYDTLFECEPYKIAPIAYSEQAQTIYLQFPGVVVAYNFDTGNMGSICRYSYEGMNFNCCSFLTSIASGIYNVHKGRDFVTNGKIMELNLPIEEIEKLSLSNLN